MAENIQDQTQPVQWWKRAPRVSGGGKGETPGCPKCNRRLVKLLPMLVLTVNVGTEQKPEWLKLVNLVCYGCEQDPRDGRPVLCGWKGYGVVEDAAD